MYIQCKNAITATTIAVITTASGYISMTRKDIHTLTQTHTHTHAGQIMSKDTFLFAIPCSWISSWRYHLHGILYVCLFVSVCAQILEQHKILYC